MQVTYVLCLLTSFDSMNAMLHFESAAAVRHLCCE